MKNTEKMIHRALGLLEPWVKATDKYWYALKEDPTMGCYGPGYLSWGVQSNWLYASAMATLASRPEVTDRKKWQERAVATLRYLLQTHVTGGRKGSDGKLWGTTWISMLGIERAMHGVALIENELPEADRVALRRMLVGEADWLLLDAVRGRHKGIGAGLWNRDGGNHPESNVWSGSLLWRTAQRYPDEPHAADWMEHAHKYFINSISMEADSRDQTVVAGKPVAERHIGANFFPNYALDHHGYMNLGYMVICVSNAALLHFDLKKAGLSLPDSMYHHQKDLWQVIRRMIFEDGRLARIGGDSRVRYAYCQEYLLPSLLFAADCFRDPHALKLAERQLALIEKEAKAGRDGRFYSRRLEHQDRSNPHYYLRLEADRAGVLAMLMNYLPLVDQPATATQTFTDSVAGGWADEQHSAVMHRSPIRLASVAWRAYGLSQALCVPPDDGSFAEWERNLSPVVRFIGDDGVRAPEHRRLISSQVKSFEGGFTACGSVMEGVDVKVDEGGSCTDQAVSHLAFAALPDGKTCLGLQYVVTAADRVGYIAEFKDLHLGVPNDLFNRFRRTVHTAEGTTVLKSPPKKDDLLTFTGRWLNVEDKLGVVVLRGGDQILIDRSAVRRGGRYKSLFVEEVCLQVKRGAIRCDGATVLTDIGFAVMAGVTAETTGRVQGGALDIAEPGARGVWVEAADGTRYALVANFGDRPVTVKEAGPTFELGPGTAVIRNL